MTEYSYYRDGQQLEPGDAVNSSLAQIALYKAKGFKEDYLKLSPSIFESGENKNKLSHAGEFGRFREKLLQNFLTQFLPARLAVGDGFLVPFLEKRSTQCDAIIYDRDSSPHMVSAGGLVMFPPEVCAAVGEVKSSLTMEKAKEALEKLAEIKKIRNEMQVSSFPVAPSSVVAQEHLLFNQSGQIGVMSEAVFAASQYQPKLCEHQALVTFLVCANIDFPKPEKGEDEKHAFQRGVLELTKDIPHELRPNFILSLSQGFLSYFIGDNDNGEVRRIPYAFPVQSIKRIKGADDGKPTSTGLRWLPSHNDHRHIMQFASEIAIVANRVPIYLFAPQMHAFDPLSFGYEFFPSV